MNILSWWSPPPFPLTMPIMTKLILLVSLHQEVCIKNHDMDEAPPPFPLLCLLWIYNMDEAPPLPLTMPIMNTYMIWMNPQPPGLCLSWIYDLSVVNILIIFFIFDNSHCTHGMSCVNKPYYIGDRTQFIGEAKIQRYIGNRCKSHTLIEQNSVQWKNHKKITLTIHN